MTFWTNGEKIIPIAQQENFTIAVERFDWMKLVLSNSFNTVKFHRNSTTQMNFIQKIDLTLAKRIILFKMAIF